MCTKGSDTDKDIVTPSFFFIYLLEKPEQQQQATNKANSQQPTANSYIDQTAKGAKLRIRHNKATEKQVSTQAPGTIKDKSSSSNEPKLLDFFLRNAGVDKFMPEKFCSSADNYHTIGSDWCNHVSSSDMDGDGDMDVLSASYMTIK